MRMWITPSTHLWHLCSRSSREVSSKCVTKIWWGFSDPRNCRKYWWAKTSTTGKRWNRWHFTLKLFSLHLSGLVLNAAVLKPEPSWFLEHEIRRRVPHWPPQHTDVLGSFWWATRYTQKSFSLWVKKLKQLLFGWICSPQMPTENHFHFLQGLWPDLNEYPSSVWTKSRWPSELNASRTSPMTGTILRPTHVTQSWSCRCTQTKRSCRPNWLRPWATVTESSSDQNLVQSFTL